MWGSLTPSEIPATRPFYQEFTPSDNITKNLKNKSLVSIHCGDDFVIAQGKDISAKEKMQLLQNNKVSKKQKKQASS